jgi:hypothetical protein
LAEFLSFSNGNHEKQKKIIIFSIFARFLANHCLLAAVFITHSVSTTTARFSILMIF